ALRRSPRGLDSPGVASDLLEKARILVDLNKHNEALEGVDAALLLMPGHANAHRLRAEILLQQERFAEAVEAMQRCLEPERERQKGLAGIYLARAKAHARLGKYGEAVEDYSRVLGLEPENMTCLANRGWAYIVLDAATLARSDFEAVLRRDPENADAYTG